jgi:hypothetical protein
MTFESRTKHCTVPRLFLTRIMLLRLFSPVALIGLVAAGSVPHITRWGDTGEISCTPISTTGLAIHNTKIPLGIRGLVLTEDFSQQQFIFENCTSTFMNEQWNETVYYG